MCYSYLERVVILCVCLLLVSDGQTIETGYVYFNSLNARDSYETTLRVPASQWESDPVILMQGIARDGDLFVTRASARINEDINRVEITASLQEFSGGENQLHRESEIMNYIAVEEGVTRLSDGTIIQAGFASIDDSFDTIEFTTEFDDIPVVLAGLVDTFEAIIIRLQDVSTRNFQAKGQREELRNAPINGIRIAWIAIQQVSTSSINSGNQNLTSETMEIPFGVENGQYIFTQIQTYNDADPAIASINGRNDFDLSNQIARIAIQEETSADSETEHNEEIVGYVIVSHLNTALNMDEDFMVESILGVSNANSRDSVFPVFFSKTFNDPIVIGQLYGSTSSISGISSITSNGFNGHNIQWYREDGVQETVDLSSFLVSERGVYEFTENDNSVSSKLLQANSVIVQSDQNQRVRFASNFADDNIIVLAQVINWARPFSVRAWNINFLGFDLIVQTDPNDPVQTRSDILVHYIAFETNNEGESVDIPFVTTQSSGGMNVRMEYGREILQLFVRTSSFYDSEPISTTIDSFDFSSNYATVDMNNVADNSMHGANEDIVLAGLSTQSIQNLQLASVDTSLPQPSFNPGFVIALSAFVAILISAIGTVLYKRSKRLSDFSRLDAELYIK